MLVIDISVLFNMFAMSFVDKPTVITGAHQRGEGMIIPEAFMYTGDIFEILQTQVYFLLVMQYTNEVR